MKETNENRAATIAGMFFPIGSRKGRELHGLILRALDADAAAEREARYAEDVETCMGALDHLTNKTIGPAQYANICEAGRNEIDARIAYAREKMQATHNWREAEDDIARTALEAKP